MTRLRERQAGSVALEMVLVFPALLLTLLAVVQVALVAHASHVVEAAAAEGARAARLAGAPEAGRARAAAFVERLGREVVLSPSVFIATLTGGAVEV